MLFTTHTYYSPLIKDPLICCLWLCVCSVIVPHNIYINSQRIKPKNAPVLESKIVKIFHLKTNEKRAPCVRSTYPNPTVPGLSFFMLVSTLFDILFGFSWVLWEEAVKGSSNLLVKSLATFSYVQMHLHGHDAHAMTWFCLSLTRLQPTFLLKSNSSLPTSHRALYYRMCGGSNHVIVLAVVHCFDMLYDVLLLVFPHILMLQICSILHRV